MKRVTQFFILFTETFMLIIITEKKIFMVSVSSLSYVGHETYDSSEQMKGVDTC